MAGRRGRLTPTRTAITLDPKWPGRATGGFLAALAYPDARDAREAIKFRTAIAAWELRLRIDAEPGRVWGFDLTEGALLYELDLDEARQRIAAGRQRLFDRLDAADVAAPVLANAELAAMGPVPIIGTIPGWPHLRRVGFRIRVDGQPPTVNAMSRLLAERLSSRADRDAASANWKIRVWSPSRPVLHAALALRSMVRTLPEQRLRFPALFSAGAVRQLVLSSRLFQAHVERSLVPTFRGEFPGLIGFRLYEAAEEVGSRNGRNSEPSTG